MARLNQTDLSKAAGPYLQKGEEIIHCAYGIKQPHMLLIAAAGACGALPAVILLMLTQKYYVVVQTDRRLLVLRVGQGKRLPVHEVHSYNLHKVENVKTSSWLMYTHIRFDHAGERFAVKFHRMNATDNMLHSRAIATALCVEASCGHPTIEAPVMAEVVHDLSLSA